MVVTEKNIEVHDRFKIWHVVKATNSFVCVTFLSVLRLYRSKTLGCWQDDGWSMATWSLIIKGSENFSQSTNKWQRNIVSHCPNWKNETLSIKTKNHCCHVDMSLPWQRLMRVTMIPLRSLKYKHPRHFFTNYKIQIFFYINVTNKMHYA